jgi:hypothetical protein
MAGFYWIGNNGNVYANRDGSVQDYGKADALKSLSSSTGGTAGFDFVTNGLELIDNPSNTQKTTAPTGGGGGGTTYKDTSAQRAAAQASLDSLGTIQANRLSAEETAYQNLLQEYANEKAKEQAKFGEQTTKNEVNLDKQNQASMLAAAQGGRGLRATLAAMGALGGTGSVLADRAITDSANKDLGGARDNFETNAETLQTAWGDYEDLDKKRQTDANNVRLSNRNAVETDILTTRQKLLQDMASYWEQAGNTGQYGANMAEATGLTSQIAARSAPTAQAYTRQDASFKPGELSGYLAGNRDMTVGRQAGAAGSPALNNPLYALSSKKEKELV